MTFRSAASPSSVLEGSLDHLQAVHRLTAATVAATTVEAIYEAALDALVSSVPVDRAAILLFDRDGALRFKAWRGLSEGYRQAVEGHSPWRPDDAAPEPIVLADAAVDPGLGDLREVVLEEGIRSLAFVPLLYDARLLGKFMLYGDQPRRLDPAEVALAQTVAAHVAFALEKRRLEDELRLSAEKLGTTLNAVSEGITVQSPAGRLLLANEAAAEMIGFSSVDDLLAASPQELVAHFELRDEDGQPLDVERLPGRAALRGEEPPEILVRWKPANGTERFSLVRSRPVNGEDGEVRFAVNVFRDVTDRQLALQALRASEARLTFLASAGRRLLTTDLDPRRVLEEVASLVVPELADWCTVSELAESGALVRVGARTEASRRQENRQLLVRLERYGDLLHGHPALGDLTAGRSVLMSEVTPAMLEAAAQDEEHLALLHQLGLRSVLLVPLRTRGRTIGVLTLAAGAGRPPYGPADLALAEDLASRAAAAVDNARSFATERATAETLARALLPGRLPDIPGLQLAARYRASGDVGGDFYDCFPIDGGSWMLVVGDVCGRGIHAASMTGLTRHTIRAAALHEGSPTTVLRDLNRLLLDAAGEEMPAWLAREEGAGPSFCTVCLAAITPTPTGARVVVSSAGHPLPMLVGHDAEVTEVGRAGSLLGVLADLELTEQALELGAGDALVLFTDGITERRRDRGLFEEHLPTTLRGLAGMTAAEMARRVEEAAVDFGTGVVGDDMAVLVLCVPGATPPATGAPAGGLVSAKLATA